MKCARRSVGRQRGFALVAAIFLLVVIAVLGAFAVRTNMNQQHATDLDLAMLRAEAAAHSGIQYAAARVLATNDCSGVQGERLNLPQDFHVDLLCATQDPLPAMVNALPVNVFLVTATASHGLYGSPEFVSRQRSVRITP